MRVLNFHAQFGAGRSDRAILRLRPGAKSLPMFGKKSALRKLAQSLNENAIAPMIELTAALKGQPALIITGQPGERNDIVFELPPETVCEPWRVACLLNLLDFATTIGADPEEPEYQSLIAVRIDHAAVAELTLDEAYDDLRRQTAQAIKEMQSHLPETFDLNDSDGRVWPVDQEDYSFDATLGFAAPLNASQQNGVKHLAETLDAMLAWTAFETEIQAEDWLGDGLIPYPVAIEVSESFVRVSLEDPPSNPALPLLLLSAGLAANTGGKGESWALRIWRI